MPPAKELVADKGYDSKALREWLAERGTMAVIPPRKNRKVQYAYNKVIWTPALTLISGTDGDGCRRPKPEDGSDGSILGF
jgi:hypothetical protein